MDIVQVVSDFGFPVVMVVGLGYFVYFVWQTITNQDMIRLQQKVNTVLELKEKDDRKNKR